MLTPILLFYMLIKIKLNKLKNQLVIIYFIFWCAEGMPILVISSN